MFFLKNYDTLYNGFLKAGNVVCVGLINASIRNSVDEHKAHKKEQATFGRRKAKGGRKKYFPLPKPVLRLFGAKWVPSPVAK